MKIESKMLFSMTEAIHNLYNALRVVDDLGAAILTKNGYPKYVIIDFNRISNVNATDEDVLVLAHKLVEQNGLVYEEMNK